mmetsp:Transcript_13381/g.44077  ORF Transcript_13381/g.44077 Transcript_13381/m.44077 type:complete len:242 (-) Transcript_13381:58-783(-)
MRSASTGTLQGAQQHIARTAPARAHRRVARTKALSADDEQGPSTPGYRGAYVSSLSLPMQTATVAGIGVSLLAATWSSCGVFIEPVNVLAPEWLKSFSAGSIGAVYVLAGVSHFVADDGYVSMVPHDGAWGFWSLPGSPEFHVRWTGVAEIAGGAGMLAGAINVAPAWLGPTAAEALALLTIAVSPANVYMATHNAPGPGPPVPEGEEPPLVPASGHAARFVLQVALLTALWACAHPAPGA